MLSDRGLNVARTCGVLYGLTAGKHHYPEMEGLQAKRSFFFVDEQGVIPCKWLGEDLDVFPTEELLEAAREVAAKRSGMSAKRQGADEEGNHRSTVLWCKRGQHFRDARGACTWLTSANGVLYAVVAAGRGIGAIGRQWWAAGA